MENMRGHNMRLRTALACKEDNLTEEDLGIVRFIYKAHFPPYDFVFPYEIRALLKDARMETDEEALCCAGDYKIYGGILRYHSLWVESFPIGVPSEEAVRGSICAHLKHPTFCCNEDFEEYDFEGYLDKLYEKLTEKNR